MHKSGKENVIKRWWGTFNYTHPCIRIGTPGHPLDELSIVLMCEPLKLLLDLSLSVSRSGVDLSGGNLEMLVENDRLVVDWGGDQVNFILNHLHNNEC